MSHDQNQNPLLDPTGRYVGRATALAQTLAQVLGAQRDLYIQLATLARQQSEFIAQGASEDLMTVLATRSRLIDELAPLDKQLSPYKDRWQEVLDSLAGPDREQVSMLLTQVQQLLSDILEQDEADRQVLLRQKTDISSQISRSVTGGQLHRAYGVKPKPASPGMGMG